MESVAAEICKQGATDHFFDTQGVIYQHFWPPKTKINSDYYLKVLQILCTHITQTTRYSGHLDLAPG